MRKLKDIKMYFDPFLAGPTIGIIGFGILLPIYGHKIPFLNLSKTMIILSSLGCFLLGTLLFILGVYSGKNDYESYQRQRKIKEELRRRK